MDKDRFYSAKPIMKQTVESKFPLGSGTSCISEDKNKNNVQNESISEKKGTVRCPLCEAFFQDESAVEMHMISAHNTKKEIVKTVIASFNELDEQENSKYQPSAGTMQLDMNLTNTVNLSRLTNQEMDKDRFYSAKPITKQTVDSKFPSGSSTSCISEDKTENGVQNESISEKKGTLPCPICEAFFQDESAVEMHMISTHKTHKEKVKTVRISFNEQAEKDNSKCQPAAGTRPFDMSPSSNHDMKLLEKMHMPNTDCPSNKEIYDLTQFPLHDPLQRNQDYLKQQALNSIPSTSLPPPQKDSQSSKQPCRNVSFQETFFQPLVLNSNLTEPDAHPFLGSQTNTFQDGCPILPNIPQKQNKGTSLKSNSNSTACATSASATTLNTSFSSVPNNVKYSNDKKKITDKASKFTPNYVHPETAIQMNPFYPLNMMHANYVKGVTTPINIGMNMNSPFAVANRLPPGMAAPLMNPSIPAQIAPPFMPVQTMSAQIYQQQLCQKQEPKWMHTKRMSGQIEMVKIPFDGNNLPTREQIEELPDKTGLTETKKSFSVTVVKDRPRDSIYNFNSPRSIFLHTDEYAKFCDTMLKRIEPGINMEWFSKKSNWHFTKPQTEYLRQQFKENHYPKKATMENIARKIGLEAKSVKNWFQNARARIKKRDSNSLNRSQASSSLLDTSPCNANVNINSGSINGPSLPSLCVTANSAENIDKSIMGSSDEQLLSASLSSFNILSTGDINFSARKSENTCEEKLSALPLKFSPNDKTRIKDIRNNPVESLVLNLCDYIPQKTDPAISEIIEIQSSVTPSDTFALDLSIPQSAKKLNSENIKEPSLLSSCSTPNSKENIVQIEMGSSDEQLLSPSLSPFNIHSAGDVNFSVRKSENTREEKLSALPLKSSPNNETLIKDFCNSPVESLVLKHCDSIPQKTEPPISENNEIQS